MGGIFASRKQQMRHDRYIIVDLWPAHRLHTVNAVRFSDMSKWRSGGTLPKIIERIYRNAYLTHHMPSPLLITVLCWPTNQHIIQLPSCHVDALTLSQWSSSGNPVCLELRPQCTLECHWRNASVLPVVFQWSSSGFPVVFQCVPIMQINTGSPLGHHWVQASASVVPVASQCTCGSSGLPVCSNYAN